MVLFSSTVHMDLIVQVRVGVNDVGVDHVGVLG